jgi:hypothetical protein
MGDNRDQDEQGFEGDISDHAGDRLGGGKTTPADVQIQPEDLETTRPSED